MPTSAHLKVYLFNISSYQKENLKSYGGQMHFLSVIKNCNPKKSNSLSFNTRALTGYVRKWAHGKKLTWKKSFWKFCNVKCKC